MDAHFIMLIMPIHMLMHMSIHAEHAFEPARVYLEELVCDRADHLGWHSITGRASLHQYHLLATASAIVVKPLDH